MAIFGSVRLASKAPWTQRRRIIGMIKSPVEGSTAALVRLETAVVFSDHVRPICLPDELKQKQKLRNHFSELKTERLEKQLADELLIRRIINEKNQYFNSPHFKKSEKLFEGLNATSPAYMRKIPQLGTLTISEDDIKLSNYPIADGAPQVNYYDVHKLSTNSTSTPNPTLSVQKSMEQIWGNCNTLGWSRQRSHLQRVQLSIGDMETCENISIATINSICTEATYQKHDCTVSTIYSILSLLLILLESM